MRKTALILAVMLVLSAVCPSQAKSGEHTAGTGNQGYIVKLKDTGAEENVPSGSECLRAISGRARLYHDKVPDTAAHKESGKPAGFESFEYENYIFGRRFSAQMRFSPLHWFYTGRKRI